MNVLDLFCGACGGWSLGLHSAGAFSTVAACEADEWRRAQFARNFPKARLYDDVRTLTAARLAADGIIPDIVVGSPPCQDASTANTRGRGIDGERTGLYMEAVRIVGEGRPRWFAFENVPGIRNRGIDRVLGALEEIGYACWPLVVGACDLGAPHVRQRSWVIGADAATVQRITLPWHQSNGNSERAAAKSESSRGWSGLREAGAVRDGAFTGDSAPSTADAEPAKRRSLGRARGRQRAHDDGKWQEGSSRPSAGVARNACGEGLEGHERQPVQSGAKLHDLADRIAGRLGPIAENWNGGIADRFGMDDGLPKGMARPLLAAYGDAVVPQVAEIIGRSILAAEGLTQARAA